MRIKSIEITGMRKIANAKYDLSSINYIVGENGRGKSTILNAIQLALLGYIPGQAKTNAAVMQNSKGKVLSVTAVLDGVTISRTWTKKSSTVQGTVDITPEGYDINGILDEIELPIFNFSELLGKSSNQQKDYFISILPQTESSIDVRERIIKAQEELGIPEEYVDDVTKSVFEKHDSFEDANSLDTVRSLNDWLKQELSATNSELDRNSKTIQSLVYYDDCDKDMDDREYEDKIKQLNTELSDIRLYQSQKSQHDAWMIQMNQFAELEEEYCKISDYSQLKSVIAAKANIDKLTESNNSISEKISEISVELQSISSKVSVLDANIVANQKIVDSGGVCQYTNTVCAAIQEMIDSIKGNIERDREEIAGLNVTISKLTDDKKNLEEEHRNNLIKINHLESDISSEKGSYEKYNTLIQSEIKITVDEPTESIESVETTIKKYTDILVKIRANVQYNLLIDKLTRNKAILEFKIQLYKRLIRLTGANELQTEISNEAFNQFADRISAYLTKMMSENVTASFNLSSAANSFSFGINKVNEDIYIPYSCLSSGEKCMYLIAFAYAILDNSKSPLKVMMIDDMLDHLDDNNAESVFTAATNLNDIQVIFAGVKICNISSDRINFIKV